MHIPIIFAIIQIFGIFAVGALAGHLKYIRKEDLDHWSRLIIDFLFPLLIFSSIIKNLQPEQFSELWILPLIGFGLMAFGGLLGTVLKYGMKNATPDRIKTFHHFCAVNNYGFLPIIIITNLWGAEYLPFLFILNIGSGIAYWTIGIALLGDGDFKKTIKNVISPCLIALCLALILTVLRIKWIVPEVLIRICESLGSCAVPAMLLLIGASLYGSREITKNKRDITYLTFVRLLLIPFLSILILKLLPLPKQYYNITFIVAIMPVSVSTTILTRRYGGCTEFAGQAALITTLASIITIPLMLYLM